MGSIIFVFMFVLAHLTSCVETLTGAGGSGIPKPNVNESSTKLLDSAPTNGGSSDVSRTTDTNPSETDVSGLSYDSDSKAKEPSIYVDSTAHSPTDKTDIASTDEGDSSMLQSGDSASVPSETGDPKTCESESALPEGKNTGTGSFQVIPDTSSSASEAIDNGISEVLESLITGVTITDSGTASADESTLNTRESERVKQKEDSDNFLILDLTTNKHFSSHKIYLNDNPAIVYVPLKGYKYIKLVNNKTIWKAHDMEYAYMVYHVIKNDDKMVMILTKKSENEKYCLINRGNEWKDISKFTFYRKIMLPFEAEKQFIVYDLDIGEKNHKHSTLVVCYLDYVDTKIYFDNRGHKIGLVKFDNQKLYTTNFLIETVIKVNVSLFYGLPLLAEIEVFVYGYIKIVRFELINGVWKKVDLEKYESIIKKCRKYNKFKHDVKTNVATLNLNNVDPSKFLFQIRSQRPKQVSTIQYIPKDENKLGFIVADSHVIWMSELDGEDCIILATYINDKAVLLSIDHKSHRKDKFLCYQNLMWNEITRLEYNSKIVDLYNQM